MRVEIRIVGDFLKDKNPTLFEIEKKNGEKIDAYNDLLYGGKYRINSIPQFIDHVLDGGYDYNSAGFIFGPVTELDKVWVDADMVEFYVGDYKILYSKIEVLEFTIQLAKKSLEAVSLLNLKEKELVGDEWIESIQLAVPQLEEKLTKYL